MIKNVKLKSLPLSQVKIDDKFWNKYIKLTKDVIIPYQWKILNDEITYIQPSGCIKNFKVAAGLEKGKFSGAVFQDSDIAKWLEAVAYSLDTEADKELEELADKAIELIEMVQDKSGYINTYFTIKEPSLRWTNLMEGHELYTAGHLIEAAVAYYYATGKDKFLNIMIKFADLICTIFGYEENQMHGYPGHQEIELALVKLYEVTGNKRYIDTAKYFLEVRGKSPNYLLEEEKGEKFKRIFPEFENYTPLYSQSHIPVIEQETAEGHAVRAVYMYCAMADVAFEYNDEKMFKACERLWDNIVNKRMYITGSIGSSGLLERFTTDYDLPNDSNYSETCASIGLALFGLRMAKITKEAKYIDTVERALYNTLLSGIAMDGKSFFYVNPLEVWPESCISRTSKEHVKAVRQKWFGVACCPPNIARTLASLGQYIYLVDDKQVYINLFISNETTVNIGNNQLNIKIDTNFPNENSININILSEEKVSLAIRIPEYAENYCIYINEEKYKFDIKNGYAILNNICDKDKIKVEFESPAQFVRANPLVRADLGKVALTKGPLVYCIEEVDNGKNLSAIFVDADINLNESYADELLGGTTVIEFEALRVDNKPWDNNKLYSSKKNAVKNVKLKAIPYGYWGNRVPGEMYVWMKEKM